MRNDIKPVIPPRASPDAPTPPARAPTTARPAGRADFPPAGESDFDREHGSSVRRERGDATDPVGPKRSAVYGAMGTGGAVTDPSGTTGPVSRSNSRTSTTTGRLRDRDMERSARQGEAPDISVLNIPTGTRSLSVPVLMSALAAGIALLFLIAWLSWPESSPYDDALEQVDPTAANDAKDEDE